MKQLNDLKNLCDFLAAENIHLSEQQISKLKIYLSELLSFADKHRIVSNKDINHIVSRHFLSSFYFVKVIKNKISDNDNILDLGSGAGFPGILLSIYFPNKIVMVDSVRKKALFLSRIKRALNLNCDVINDRIENFAMSDKREFKIITARALASINDLIDLAHSFLQTGVLYTLKGTNYKDEFSGREKEINLSADKIDSNWIKYSDYLENKVSVAFTLQNETIV